MFGCGGVGLGGIAGSAFRGARTIAINMDSEKLATARAVGASHTIHAQSGYLHKQLQELTDGLGPDIIVESIGLPATFHATVEEVSFSGTVVYIGYAKQPVTYETKLFVQKELTILGSRNALDRDFKEAIAMLEAGRFPVDRAISVIISIDELPDMIAAWFQEPALYTKIMVNMAD